MDRWGALEVLEGLALGLAMAERFMDPKGPPGSAGSAQVSLSGRAEACGARAEVDRLRGERLSARRLGGLPSAG